MSTDTKPITSDPEVMGGEPCNEILRAIGEALEQQGAFISTNEGTTGATDEALKAICRAALTTLQHTRPAPDVVVKALRRIRDRAQELRNGTDDWFELTEFALIANEALTALQHTPERGSECAARQTESEEARDYTLPDAITKSFMASLNKAGGIRTMLQNTNHTARLRSFVWLAARHHTRETADATDPTQPSAADFFNLACDTWQELKGAPDIPGSRVHILEQAFHKAALTASPQAEPVAWSRDECVTALIDAILSVSVIKGLNECEIAEHPAVAKALNRFAANTSPPFPDPKTLEACAKVADAKACNLREEAATTKSVMHEAVSKTCAGVAEGIAKKIRNMETGDE